MQLAVGNHVARIIDISDEELEWLDEYLSISEPAFRKDYRTGRMIQRGTITHSYLKKDQFPAGFIRLINKACKREGYPLIIEDERNGPSVEPVPLDVDIVNNFNEEIPKRQDIADGIKVKPWVRYYQHDAIEQCVKRRRGIIWHTTGAGKTEVAVMLTLRLPVKWLFVVQDKTLLHNAARRYEERTGFTANIIGDGIVKLDGTGNFTVAMAQTLASRRNDQQLWDSVRSAEGLIIDECHQTPAKTIFQITMATELAVYRIGLSGTPFDRGDQKGMATIGALGPVIHRIKGDELICAGFLSEAKINMLKHEADSAKPTYQGAYADLIVRNTKRNNLVVDAMCAVAKPNLTFVKQVNHGKALLKRAEKRVINVGFVWGEKNTKERDKAVDRLLSGDIDALICNVIFQQGVDIPELKSIVRASAGKSAISTLQTIGRGMRVTLDKNSFEYVDVYDVGNKWMEAHSKERRKSYEREGHKVNVVENPSQLLMTG